MVLWVSACTYSAAVTQNTSSSAIEHGWFEDQFTLRVNAAVNEKEGNRRRDENRDEDEGFSFFQIYPPRSFSNPARATGPIFRGLRPNYPPDQTGRCRLILEWMTTRVEPPR